MPSDSVDVLRLSFLTPIGYQTSSCGYCKDPDSSASYYATAKKLTPEDYQSLVDRGWRRSGTLLYKPDNRLSCCAQYTIRLPVADFKCRKDQRSALHRWNRYVLGEQYATEAALKYPKTKEEKKRQRNDFDLTASLHEAEYSNIRQPPKPAHRFEVTLEEDSFTQEKFALFQHYQAHVHHEPASQTTPSGFRRFLCDSPLVRDAHYDSATGVRKHLGSYHEMYRLDGRLIAIGVLDLLPDCVSGVYFIYHADFEKFSFGKLSALREATRAREYGYGYYYMGYYIHSCAKMRYKGDYQPQHFLDLDSFDWVPLDDKALALMEKKTYVSMSREEARKRRREERLRIKPAGGDALMAEADELDEQRRTDKNDDDDEGEDDDDDEKDGVFLFDSARQAHESGLSALQLGMPGVMTINQVEEQIDLDNINVQVARDIITQTSNLTVWHTGSTDDPTTLKGVVAEFAGCVGPGVARPDRSVIRLMRD